MIALAKSRLKSYPYLVYETAFHSFKKCGEICPDIVVASRLPRILAKRDDFGTASEL